jgi:hypothetical protein
MAGFIPRARHSCEGKRRGRARLLPFAVCSRPPGFRRGGDCTPVEGGDPARKCVDEPIQFGVRKCPIDVSGSLRGVTVKVIRAENDFERPTAADQMWKALRTAATGMHSHTDFGLTQPCSRATRNACRKRGRTRCSRPGHILLEQRAASTDRPQRNRPQARGLNYFSCPFCTAWAMRSNSLRAITSTEMGIVQPF